MNTDVSKDCRGAGLVRNGTGGNTGEAGRSAAG
jgi:hypothetical protein